jgi:hypothetical protein
VTLQALWANNDLATLASGITSTQTTITLTSGEGALFPNPTSGQQVFSLTLITASNLSNFEIVYCTARSGDTLTVVRGQEGTGAQAFNAGDLAQGLITAGLLGYLVQAGAPWTWTATQTHASPIVLDNAVQLQGKNTGGTAYNLITMTSGNIVTLSGGPSGFNINNNANSAVNFTMTDAGVATFGASGGGLTVSGSNGLTVSVNATVDGILEVLGNAAVAGTLTSTGAGDFSTVLLDGGVVTATGGLTTGVLNPISSQTDGFQVIGNGSAQVYCTANTPLGIGGQTGALIAFFYGNSVVGSITSTGSGVVYNMTSDYSIKTIHGKADGSWVSKLPIYDAEFKNGLKHRHPMLLAHELQELAPTFVYGDKDAVDTDGKPVLQQVDMMSMLPSVIAYAQSLEAKIEALMARICKLEAKG